MQKKGLNTGKKKGSDRLTGYAMIAPFFILLMLFVIVPIVINVILSFMNYNMREIHFVGFTNYIELFKDKWDSKYPKIYKSWHDNWATLSTYFKYPEAVRRLIYTTNAIEGFNRQLRKVTKSKTVFPSDDSLLKMLYLATMDITKKWTGHRQDWGQIHSQLEIYFEERLAGRNL